MIVEIDKQSGYCFGVEFAIRMAENEMEGSNELYCLGDIVHNSMEVERLAKKGLKIIEREDLKNLSDAKVLIRAHGEPPETYRTAIQNNIELIDASCPVVLKLQNRVKSAFDLMKDSGGQVVIYGKKGHAEVIGLSGQTQGQSIIVMDDEDLEEIDYTKEVYLLSQTTKSTTGFQEISEKIRKRIKEVNEGSDDKLVVYDSICRQVSNREPQLKVFADKFDLILFVSGKKSSNGKSLFKVCKNINDNTHFIEHEGELDDNWFQGVESVGICGATSTPMWLMEKVADKVNLEFGQLEQV